MKRFALICLVFLFTLSVTAQAFANGACCFAKKTEISTKQSNLPPCHQMANAKTDNKPATKSEKKSCCCDINACFTKAIVKNQPTVKTNNLSDVVYVLSTQTIFSNYPKLSEQPPKFSA
jgi:hypothetical protein